MESTPRHFEEPSVEKREAERKPRLKDIKEMRGKEVVATTMFEYDAAGRVALKERKYPRSEGKTSQIFGYDERGRQTSVHTYIEYKGPLRNDPGMIRHEGVLEKSYVGDTDLVQMESYGRDGSTTNMIEYEYDGNGRKIVARKTDFGSIGPKETITSYKYDDHGRPIEKVISEPDERPIKYEYLYDKNGRLVQENRGFVDSERRFGAVMTAYKDGGLTEINKNYYGTELVWTSTSKKDENGNLVGTKFENNDTGHVDEKVIVNTYE